MFCTISFFSFLFIWVNGIGIYFLMRQVAVQLDSDVWNIIYIFIGVCNNNINVFAYTAAQNIIIIIMFIISQSHKYYISVLEQAAILNFMVVQMFENKKSNKSFFGRIAKLALVTTVVLVALSFQASACHVGDKVWNDLDMDGIQDTGESGIAGVTVKLYDNSGNYIKTTTTDTNGLYNFAVSRGLSYKVVFVLPDGYTFSPKNVGSDRTLDSDANQSNGMTDCIYIARSVFYRKWDAGMYQTASIGNYVWNDVNNNGVQDGDEPGIFGVEVQLYNEAGYVSSVTTDSTGFYEFTGLTPGEYVLLFVKPDGYVYSPSGQGSSATDSDVVKPSGSTAKITLAAGEYNNEIDAGLFTESNEEIPEFPTVVLPMAAIIGLAFVFQRRKE